MSGIKGTLLTAYGFGYKKSQEIIDSIVVTQSIRIPKDISGVEISEISGQNQDKFYKKLEMYCHSPKPHNYFNGYDLYRQILKSHERFEFKGKYYQIVHDKENKLIHLVVGEQKEVLSGLKLINPKRFAIAAAVTVAGLAFAAHWVSGLFSDKKPAPTK